jgi:tetratricopeptide (TPR) repeat protein
MRGFSLSFITLSVGMAFMPLSWAAPTVQQQLLEQVRLGEASKRDDLVRQSLYRLELIAPDDPDVMAARVRYLLRQGNNAGAQKLLARLKKNAPDSTALKQAQVDARIATAQGRQALQQARLLATTGHVSQAVAQYNALFNGSAPPDGSLAVEYWLLVAREPAQRAQAIAQLQGLNQRIPGDNTLRAGLAQLLFDNGRPQEGFKVLEQMARSSGGRGQAADMWYAQLDKMPVGDASVAALQRFLSLFDDGEAVDKARTRLAQQQQQLSNPGLRARAQGLAAVASGKDKEAVSLLKTALSENKKDAELVAALGEVYSRQNNRAAAVRQFHNALRLDPNNDSAGRWKGLLQTNQYWLLIDEGDRALKANNSALARQKYRQARSVDNTDSYAVLGLGDAAAAVGDDAGAERYYRQALRMDSDNSNAVRGLANVYRRQSPARAEAFIQSLNAKQRRSIDDIERSLTDTRLEQQASALEAQGRWAQAAELHRRRLQMAPDSVWIVYRLAKDLAANGQRQEADGLFYALASKKPGDPDQVYAWSLYFSGTDRDTAALGHLDTLAKSQWTDNIQALADRLRLNQIMAAANRLRDSGQEPRAIALLQQQPPRERVDLVLADWAGQRRDYPQARALYQKVLARSPTNDEALLGLSETAVAQGDSLQARSALSRFAQLKPDEPPSINVERRVANVYAALGDVSRARQIYNRLIPQARRLPPSMNSALFMRDAARFQAQNGQPEQALATWRDAMAASGVADKRPESNDSFTRLMRNNEKDDWLKRGVRSDAADLYRQQDVNVTLDYEYWGSSGTPGYSDLKAHTTMLQADAPLSDGRMFFRADIVNMNAGSFGASHTEKWGTCYEHGCDSAFTQRASGASVAVGWRNDVWEGDIGTTPMGFDVVDVVGGLSYSGDAGPIGYTVNAHRRPVSSSMLSFAGQRDPNTNRAWGGVRASGAGVSISYDKGEAHGVWSSLGMDRLSGRNVANNWRARWMTGYYYKLVNENNRRLTVGLNNMLWHYDKDLSGYTLGQGGYYSPQEYVSFAVPVVWRQRTENWSWELGGTVSWSHSKTRDRRRYPLSNLIPNVNDYPDKFAMETGAASSGVGYTARLLMERRLTSHWSLGAGVDIQQAKDYTPSRALLFLRYSRAGWQGDMDMPPQPLVPYADW